jgi:hypothetical protein
VNDAREVLYDDEYGLVTADDLLAQADAAFIEYELREKQTSGGTARAQAG